MELKCVGTNFRAPRKNDARRWRMLEKIGFVAYHHGGGMVPKNNAELNMHLKARRDQKRRFDAGLGLTNQERRFKINGAVLYSSSGRGNVGPELY